MNMESKGRKERGSVLIPRGVMIVFCCVVPALLVAALIISGFWGNNNRTRAEALRRTNEGIYTQAYTELADSVYNMQIALSKLMVSEAPATLTGTLDDIRFESGVIAGLMGRIPQSHVDSYELNRFLIQVGDYAKQLSRALLRGGRLTEDDRGQLMEVFTASEGIYNDLAGNLHEGNIPLSALDGEGFFTQTAQGGEDGDGGENSAQDGANSRYPTLIYDGPFSESTEKREPRGLNGEETDQSAALKRARELLGDENASLEYGGVSGGRIPFHGFSGSAGGRNAEIALSVTGGELLYFRLADSAAKANSGANESENMSGATEEEWDQDARREELLKLEAAGKEWLIKTGYPEMEATHAQFYENCVLISFAAVEECEFTFADRGLDALLLNGANMSELINEIRYADGLNEPKTKRVILYNDIVKLWIERETGSVIGADAENYLFSHAERELPSEIISPERAAKRLSSNLEIEKTALALIPLPDQTERLCHEFTGSFAGAEYVIYLDARTGDEVQIFRIINDENGTGVL